MHLKRWLTAIIALPLLITLIYYGGEHAFAMLVVAVSLLGLSEYYAMVLPAGEEVCRWTGLIAGFLLSSVVYLYGIHAASAIIAIIFIGISIVLLLRFGKEDSISDTLARLIFGVIYIPFLLAHLILIRNQPNGIIWTFFVLFVVFALDTGAYYVGTYAGKHKLYPAVSPKKTWEGAAGGVSGALLVGALFKICFLIEFEWLHLIAMTICMGIFGGIGDLVESMIKRSMNVKDSGRLLPGHGGVLDRIDALLFVAPIVYYYKIWLIS